jgi:hypothetical protein
MPGVVQRSAMSLGAVQDALAEAVRRLDMDVAVLGEVRDGLERCVAVAGDADRFGLVPGVSLPTGDTYCERLLTGRLDNVVRDVQHDERVADLPVTDALGIGAYIAVALCAMDARLYVFCCLSREARPALAEPDVRLLRRLGESILAALDRDSRGAPRALTAPSRYEQVLTQVCDELDEDSELDEIDALLDSTPALPEDERAALWLYAWSRTEVRDGHTASVRARGPVKPARGR